jgi:hypothetical protein
MEETQAGYVVIGSSSFNRDFCVILMDKTWNILDYFDLPFDVSQNASIGTFLLNRKDDLIVVFDIHHTATPKLLYSEITLLRR